MLDYVNKINQLLGKEARPRLGLFVLGFLALSILELIGISLVGTFLAAFTSPAYLETTALGEIAQSVSGGSSAYGLAVAGAFFVVLFLMKSLATFQINRAIIQFSWGQQVRIRGILLKSYLALPLDAYAEESSSALLTSITERSVQMTNQALIPGLRALADSIFLIAILLFLLVFNWVVTLSMLGLFATLFFVYSGMIKGPLTRAGQDVLEASRGITEVINDVSHGFKEIRILGCEEYFRNLFRDSTQSLASASTYQQALTHVPRQMIEVSLVTAVVLLAVITAVTEGEGSSEGIASMGVYAFAAFRSIAGLSSLMTASNHLRFAKRAVSDLYHDLCLAENQYRDRSDWSSGSSALPVFRQQLVAEGVSYQYPTAQAPALDRVTLSIPKGSAIGIIGRSGSGKTTLVDVLLGLLRPQEGSIHVDGHDIRGRERAWMSNVAYIPQGVFLLDASIIKNVALGVREGAVDAERLDAAVKLAQLSEAVSGLAEGLETVVGERGVRLSGGQRQRVALARAFYNERDVIVMDEATAALDNETERLVVEAIRNLRGKKTVIVIAHRLTTVKHCDIIYKLEAGRVVASGTYDEVVGESPAV